MRFHLIDHVVSCTPRESVHARKATSLSETFWDDGQTMPAHLVLESLCQAGTWLIMESTQQRQRAALLQVGSVRVSGPVKPGDVVDLHGEVVSFTDEVAVLRGRADVDGHTVLTAEDIMCALLDADELAGPDESARMLDMLMRR